MLCPCSRACFAHFCSLFFLLSPSLPVRLPSPPFPCPFSHGYFLPRFRCALAAADCVDRAVPAEIRGGQRGECALRVARGCGTSRRGEAFHVVPQLVPPRVPADDRCAILVEKTFRRTSSETLKSRALMSTFLALFCSHLTPSSLPPRPRTAFRRRRRLAAGTVRVRAVQGVRLHARRDRLPLHRRLW